MPPRGLYLSLALIAGAALLYEVTLIRMLSVALWYPFAYLALSTAMLGFGGAAVVVTLSQRLRAVATERLLRVCTLGFAATCILGYPLWNLLPVKPMSMAHELDQFVWIPLLVVVLTLPFACAGLFITRVFGDHPAAATRLYAADLAGATAGVIAFVILVPHLGAPATLVVAGALGVLAEILRAPTGPSERTIMALVIVGLLSVAPAVEDFLPLRVTPNKLLGDPQAGGSPRRLRWGLSSAVDVIPADYGHLIIIDGGTAMTVAPKAVRSRASRKPPPPSDLRAVPYRLGPGRSTMIIGSGGGREVMAALGADSKRILALEIDPIINALVRGDLSTLIGGLFAHPSVELVTADARSYLAALDPSERFDAIMGFHAISNAASSSGAMSLAENYLLTIEAMEQLLARLSDDGVLVLSRPEQQIARLAATLAAAYDGDDFGRHVAIVTGTNEKPAFLAALVFTARPMDAQMIAAMREVTAGRVAYAPDGSGDSQAYIAAAIAGEDPDPPFEAARAIPTTDDKPFFNLHRSWSSLGWNDVTAILGADETARARLEDLPVAQVAIVILIVQLLMLSGVFVVPPLVSLRRQGVPRPLILSTAGLFSALGFGFILVEIVLIQTLTRLVGTSGWSMISVLAVLLISTGGGSLLLAGKKRWSVARGCAGAAGAALGVAFVAPLVADAAASLPFPARLLAVVAIVAPTGLLLGVPFSAAMERLERAELVAWGWALNSLLSVAGSVTALVFASALGFRAATLLAVGVYVGGALIARSMSATQGTSTPP